MWENFQGRAMDPRKVSTRLGGVLFIFFFCVFFLDLFSGSFLGLGQGFWDLWVPVGWTGVPIREASPAGAVQFGVMASGNNKDYLQVFGFPGKSTKYVKQINEVMMIYLVQKRVTILLILPSTNIPDIRKV
jgi:hypothetical protein